MSAYFSQSEKQGVQRRYHFASQKETADAYHFASQKVKIREMHNLYTDGGSRNNPGFAAIGGALFNENATEVFNFSEFIGIATNNVAEYTALIRGLKLSLDEGASALVVYLDSELVVKQLNSEYKVKQPELKLLFGVVKRLSALFDQISFKHVRRGDNKYADELVNKAFDSLLL